MATELEELLGFLSSPSPQVKKAAVDIVQGLTGSKEGLQSLANHSDTLLPLLLHLLGNKKEFAQPALEALINLSQETALAEKMVEIGMIQKAMEILGRADSCIIQLLVMLLVNLTQLDSGGQHFLQIGDEKLHGLFVTKLVRLFSISSIENEGTEDPYGHVGSILVNISRMEVGRKLLLDPKRSLMNQIIRQIDSPSPLRRKGAYSKEDTDKMPLELANPLSHEREPEKDPEIRVQVAEALYMIAMQEAGRRALWSVNGTRILEVGYEDEEDPQVMEAYERLGSLLVHGSGLEEDAK